MNKYALCAGAGLLAAGLAGCGSNTGSAVSADTNTALDAGVKLLTQVDAMATLYAELPSCGGTVTVCSTPSVVTKLKADASTARTDLEAAQAGSMTVAAALAALTAVNADLATLSTGK
jgi:hypothetical protein